MTDNEDCGACEARAKADAIARLIQRFAAHKGTIRETP